MKQKSAFLLKLGVFSRKCEFIILMGGKKNVWALKFSYLESHTLTRIVSGSRASLRVFFFFFVPLRNWHSVL